MKGKKYTQLRTFTKNCDDEGKEKGKNEFLGQKENNRRTHSLITNSRPVFPVFGHFYAFLFLSFMTFAWSRDFTCLSPLFFLSM